MEIYNKKENRVKSLRIDMKKHGRLMLNDAVKLTPQEIGGPCGYPEACPWVKQARSVFPLAVLRVQRVTEVAVRKGSRSWAKEAARGLHPLERQRVAAGVVRGAALNRGGSGGGQADVQAV